MAERLSELIKKTYTPEQVEGVINHIKKLRKTSKELNELDSIENTPMILAANRDLGDIVRALVEKGADLHAENFYGLTAFIWTCEVGNKSLAQYLVNKGADINLNSRYRDSYHAYHGPLSSLIGAASITLREDKHEKYKEVGDYLLSLCTSFEQAQIFLKDIDGMNPKRKQGAVYDYLIPKLDLIIEKYTLDKAVGVPQEKIPHKIKKI